MKKIVSLDWIWGYLYFCRLFSRSCSVFRFLCHRPCLFRRRWFYCGCFFYNVVKVMVVRVEGMRSSTLYYHEIVIDIVACFRFTAHKREKKRERDRERNTRFNLISYLCRYTSIIFFSLSPFSFHVHMKYKSDHIYNYTKDIIEKKKSANK